MSEKLPIEPLSEQAWSRVERQVMQRLDAEVPVATAPRRWPARSAIALVLAGAAAAIIGVVVRDRLTAQPTTSRVTTAEAGTHVVQGGAALDVGPHSDLLLSGDDEHGILVVLDQGSIDCEVTPRQGRPPVVVEAGEVHVRVVGTRFTVRREPDVTVEVSHGTVEVTTRGQSTFVHAGERWPVVKAEVIPPAAPPMVAPAPPHRQRPPTRPTRRADEPAPPPPATPAETPAPPVTPPPPSARERYEAAARIESRDPDGAIAIYRELARGEGAWAQNALYAQGRLEADRKHTAEARRLLEDYLRRFPQGANADDARELLQKLR